MNFEKILRVPIRIDFAGGTTDIYPFTHLYGGAVLNAAIDRYVVGSGLGTSGAMTLLWLALISKKKKFNKKDKTDLAEHVYLLEKTFGGVNGKQDQYAAAFGGINFMEFHNESVKVTPMKLPKPFIKKIEDSMVLVYTGKPHFAGSSNKNAIDNLTKGKNNKNLLKIKRVAQEMRLALKKRNLEKFAELLNQETEERKKLHKSTVPTHVRNFIKKGMNNGAIAAKVCGSGGGGSILFFGNKEMIKNKFKSKVIDFKFDFEGLRAV